MNQDSETPPSNHALDELLHAGEREAQRRFGDAQTLVFPDYAGNKLFNSLGNILVNPQIGMLFIDFESQTRVRVNGRAEIIETRSAYTDIWPLSQRYVQVHAEQVYGNCKARIPRMAPLPPRDSDLQDG